MACTQPPQNTRKPLPVNSAFFPNTDREEQKATRVLGHPKDTSEGVVVQPFHFPPTKQIWWDRKPQGSSEVLHLTSRRNLRLLVNEKTLRLAIKHLNQSLSPYDCFLIGSISIDSREEAVEINIDRFDPGRDFIEKKGGVKRKIPTTVVPGDQIVPLTLIKGLSGAENSATHSKKEFQRTLEILHSRISGPDALNLSNFLSLKATGHAHIDDDEIILNLHFGAVSMVTSVLATPVNPVPIIPTALARNLTGPLRLSDVQATPKCGFLTMDHTRKLLLLLESDPKAYSLPLIGVWVSGPFTIHHPYIWSCCVRFLHCTAIQERVLASPNTFLLVHYSPAQTNPIFWECSPQAQLQEGIFELYNSYENLHLDQISAPKYREPLCFELVSAGDTMNRALFNQAVNSWTKQQQNNPNENLGPPHAERKLSVENNGGILEPRPSPAPHPQLTQNPVLLPLVPEVSLSLSFEESIFSDQGQDLDGRNQNRQPFPNGKEPVLPGKDGGRILPQKNNDQVISKRNARIQDQENRTPMRDPRYASKQALVERTPIGSPLREPLRPITGQVNHMQNPSVRDPRSQNVTSEPKGLVVPKGKGCFQDRAINEGNPKAPVNVPNTHQKGPPKKAPNKKDMSMNVRGRGYSMKPRAKGRAGLKHEERRDSVKEIQDVGAQRPSLTGQEYQEQVRVPSVVVEDQNPHQKSNEEEVHENSRGQSNAIIQQRYETSSQETYNHKMNFREEQQHQFDDNGINGCQRESDIDPSGMPHEMDSRQLNDDGINGSERESDFKQFNPSRMLHQMDTRPYHRHQPNDDGINGKHNESVMDQSVFCDSGVGDSTKDTSNPEENNERHFDQSFSNSPRKEDVLSTNDKKDSENQTRPDPYDLIMRQEQQLKELQHQINLLLLQQSLTQNTHVGIPTPPPTPVSTNNSRVLSSPLRPRDAKVTMGTNTGASLLMSSPVMGRGKVSVGTSPMKKTGKNEGTRRRPRSQNNSPSTSNPTQTSMNQSSGQRVPDPAFPRESTPSSRQSLDGTTDDDELDEKGLVIERLDDTNLTLASSIHGVDICEFVGSPESTGGQRRNSDSSPVLGESASMIIQREEQEQERDSETPNEDQRFDSLLYKNEKLFYDNLLTKVNQLLCEKVNKSEETPDTSHNATQNDRQKDNEENVIHEPTRQEVLMATVKELERIKGTDIPNDTTTAAGKEVLPHNEAVFRSSFVGVPPDHPRINYFSMSVDETLDETVIETESLALKYLNKEQLQEYHHLVSNCHGNRGRGFTRALNNIGSFNDGRCVTDVDCTWNNLSMATQDYLQRYNLVGHKKETKSTRNDGDSHVSGAQALDQSREGSVASVRCSAPPSTPEPRHSETRILDIQRLRNLPKLL